jgi:hypothetical protein
MTHDTREVVILSGVRTAIGDYGGSLKDIAPSDLAARVVKEAVARAKAAMDAIRVVEEVKLKPFRYIIDTMQEEYQLNALILQGRSVESEFLREKLQYERQYGQMLPSQEKSLRAQLTLRRLQTREMEKQRIEQDRQLRLIDATQDNLRQTTSELLRGGGFKAIGNAFSRQFDAVIDDMADQITESLFGDAFRKQRERVLGLDKVSEAGERKEAR